MTLLALTATDEFDMQRLALTGQLGWMLGISAWALFLNLTFGFFNTTIKEMAEKKIIPSAKVDAIFNSTWYRLIAFLLDKLARVKLPTKASKTDTQTTPPP